jgi:hypothetical protein
MPARMNASPDRQWPVMLDIRTCWRLRGGRERTGAEYGTLFAATGFSLARILPLPAAVGVSLIEGVPA